MEEEEAATVMRKVHDDTRAARERNMVVMDKADEEKENVAWLSFRDKHMYLL